MSLDWCYVDDCPAMICNGPHIQHRCPNGDMVAQRWDNSADCQNPDCNWQYDVYWKQL